MMTGARLQQPRQDTVSSVNSRSGVVSPSLMPRCDSMASLMPLAPATWQAVPWQTRQMCLPTGWKRNWA